ncbi:hypothetical protein OESDEN_04882 [Oesophagostomum dentatum]|uniref:Uncharacterized protein n=1 Tax=Oesophagostomum dentatum TaxID=61180 RepID=A0A0B1TCC7_OESDE|nr:hypothetical protein OESDEN_04882 [Oesophagostomum dentatum]
MYAMRTPNVPQELFRLVRLVSVCIKYKVEEAIFQEFEERASTNTAVYICPAVKEFLLNKVKNLCVFYRTSMFTFPLYIALGE